MVGLLWVLSITCIGVGTPMPSGLLGDVLAVLGVLLAWAAFLLSARRSK